MAVTRARDSYADDPAIAPLIEALRAYRRTGIGGSLYSRSLILWADAQLHGVMEPAHRSEIVAAPAKSVNKDRLPGTDADLFMTDEATGMAALRCDPAEAR